MMIKGLIHSENISSKCVCILQKYFKIYKQKLIELPFQRLIEQ